MGSEMCIRDREYIECLGHIGTVSVKRHKDNKTFPLRQVPERAVFVLFDSWETGFLLLFFALFSRPMTALPSHLPVFSFFGGSFFSLCSLSCPATVFLGVFQGKGAAFRPSLFRGLKYCKRPDKKRRSPLYAEAACQVPVAPGKCACRGRARRSPEIGPKPEVCSFDRRDGAQNRENELPARKRRLRAHGSLMW